MSLKYNRWYIVPPTPGTEIVGTIPKYSENAGIGGYSGVLADKSAVSTYYAGLTQTYSGVQEWYLVKFYGSWSALNNISVKGDTRNLASNPSDVKSVLEERFPELPTRSAEEWSSVFNISVTQ